MHQGEIVYVFHAFSPIQFFDEFQESFFALAPKGIVEQACIQNFAGVNQGVYAADYEWDRELFPRPGSKLLGIFPLIGYY